MKKAFTWLMLLTVTALFATSVTPALAHTEADPQWNPLCAGSPHYYGEPGPKDPSWYWDHVTYVGGIFVWNDNENLYIKYWARDAGMDETHLAVVNDTTLFPMTKSGNPKVGRFPYKHEDLGGATYDLYTIALEWDVDTLLFIAAHAALDNGETAWADCGGGDAYFRGGNWATYFNYTIQSPPPP